MSFDERTVTDPTWIRAMAHPLRWRILDELRSSDEALTATQLSERVGESPANCSFHLRTLAKYGFIEEAGGRKGRSRPWRPRDVAMEISDTPDGRQPEGAREFRDLIRGRAFQAVETWEHRAGYDYPAAWRDAAMSAEWELKLTVDDLRGIHDEFMAIIDRYTARESSPPDAIRAKVLAWAFPIGEPAPDEPMPTEQAGRETSLRSGPSGRSRATSDERGQA